MKTLCMALAAGLVATAALAQTTANPSTSNPGTTNPGTAGAAPSAPPGTSGGTAGTSGAASSAPSPAPLGSGAMSGAGIANHAGAPGGSGDKAAAGGNDNQAVATTNANAKQPAQGANSFSRGEARRRIQGEGYSKVSNLHKDSGGVWRGKGTKDGQSVKVWLDYKGNVGGES